MPSETSTTLAVAPALSMSGWRKASKPAPLAKIRLASATAAISRGAGWYECGSEPSGRRVCTLMASPPTCSTTSATMLVVATTDTRPSLLVDDESQPVRNASTKTINNKNASFFNKSMLLLGGNEGAAGGAGAKKLQPVFVHRKPGVGGYLAGQRVEVVALEGLDQPAAGAHQQVLVAVHSA